MRRYERHRIAPVAVAALVAALVVVAAGSLMALFFPPIQSRIDPALLQDPRPVVVPNQTYTPFTKRPPHPSSVYTPPGR